MTSVAIFSTDNTVNELDHFQITTEHALHAAKFNVVYLWLPWRIFTCFFFVSELYQL